MGKKIWLIIAVVLLICGIGLFTFAMQNLGWDYRELSTTKYESRTYDITEDFENIQIDISTADITFCLSKDGKCRVECQENEKFKSDVSVIDNTLTVKENENQKWYDHIGFNIGFAKISVYLPEKAYNSLDINASTSDILIKNFAANTVKIKTSTGDIEFKGADAEELDIKTNTGDVFGTLLSDKTFVTETNTGTVKVPKSTSGGKCKIKTNTGDIKITIE